MNWKTYQSLTNEQRLEYDFKIKNHPIQFNIVSLANSITIFMLVSILLIFTLYIAQKENMFTLDKLEQLKTGLFALAKYSMYVISIYLLTGIIQLLYYIVKEIYWLKKNKIKYLWR